MAKVTYVGMMGGLAHHANPSCSTYIFQHGIPLEVKSEDAKHYSEETERGGPWKVDFGIVEKTVEVIKEITKEPLKELKKNRQRGK